MKEYIEREEVVKRIDLSITSWGRDCNSNSTAMVNAYKDVLSRLESIPTADVQEVRYGEWRPDDYEYNHCSECGYEHDTREYVTPYCPNCGAKMDKEWIK